MPLCVPGASVATRGTSGMGAAGTPAPRCGPVSRADAPPRPARGRPRSRRRAGIAAAAQVSAGAAGPGPGLVERGRSWCGAAGRSCRGPIRAGGRGGGSGGRIGHPPVPRRSGDAGGEEAPLQPELPAGPGRAGRAVAGGRRSAAGAPLIFASRVRCSNCLKNQSRATAIAIGEKKPRFS